MIQRYKRTNLCVINSHYLYDQHGHCYCEGNKQKQAGEHSLGNLVCIGARPVHRKRYNVQPPPPLSLMGITRPTLIMSCLITAQSHILPTLRVAIVTLQCSGSAYVKQDVCSTLPPD